MWPRLCSPIRAAVPLTALPLLGALGAAGIAAQASDDIADSLEELAARVTPAVVLIDVTTAADSRQGSGFIVDPAGRILTNSHVMRDARSARVRLSSGDVYEEVQVLADDPRRDIAILQIAGFDLPFLELTNSDSVRVGAPSGSRTRCRRASSADAARSPRDISCSRSARPRREDRAAARSLEVADRSSESRSPRWRPDRT